MDGQNVSGSGIDEPVEDVTMAGIVATSATLADRGRVLLYMIATTYHKVADLATIPTMATLEAEGGDDGEDGPRP